MSDRDELLELIDQMRPKDPHVIPGGRWPEALVNQILAAGYRKHREITTVEELDALPSGSTILDQNVTAIKADGVWWFQVGPFEPNLPVAVLYTPEEPQ